MTGISQRLKVKLKGGGPWGFRLLGGAGTGLPLTVAKVRRKSKSYKNLVEGDLFVSVNGVPCDGLTYDEVMAIADKGGSELLLEIERKAPKVENATVEIKSSSPTSKTTQPPTATVTSAKVTENGISERKRFTESKQTTAPSFKPGDNFSSAHQELTKLAEVHAASAKPAESKPSAKETTQTVVSSESPALTSDLTIKTSSEVTPTSKKFEKLENERIHEKGEDKETTITRTGYEELVKTHTTSESPPCPQPSSFATDTTTKQEESSVQTITRESYEIIKSEKKEVTSTTVNGFPGTPADTMSKAQLGGTAPHDEGVAAPESTSTSATSFSSPFTATDSYSMSESQFDSSFVTKKKKMFSSSSFYEEPHAIYPTVEEQFEMAKKIAESLADDTNKKSKGANMFFKRAKRSTKWIHEGPEPSSESAPETPDSTQQPPYPDFYHDGSQKKFPKLKLVLDPRHPLDAASLRSTGHNISEHNVISPEVCHELVRDLESPAGKGSALFAKRKKKSSEWVVDEEKVKALMKAYEHDIDQIRQSSPVGGIPKTPFKSPAVESPLSRYESPYQPKVDPDKLAETVIQAAENKRRDSIQSLEEHRYESCRSPIVPLTPLASYYDIYKPKAPRGWSSTTTGAPATGFTSASTIDQTTPAEYYHTYQPPSSMPRKYQFQNFNTVPRKWKAQY